MKQTKQIVVLAANQPGTLSNICGTLADEKINIRGISVVDHVDHALVRMVVEDPTKAIHLLGEAGLPVLEDDVIEMALSEGPGSLEKISQIIGEGGLNIHYLYASEPSAPGAATLILKTSDDARAVKLLREKLKD